MNENEKLDAEHAKYLKWSNIAKAVFTAGLAITIGYLGKESGLRANLNNPRYIEKIIDYNGRNLYVKESGDAYHIKVDYPESTEWEFTAKDRGKDGSWTIDATKIQPGNELRSICNPDSLTAIAKRTLENKTMDVGDE